MGILQHPQNTEPAATPAEVLEAAGLSCLPDLGTYSRIPSPEKSVGRCMWKGCNDSPVWGVSGKMQNPLCEWHYLAIKNANTTPLAVPDGTNTLDQNHETREKREIRVNIADYKRVNGVVKELCYRCGEMAYCTHVEKLTDENRVERLKRRPWFLCLKCAKELLNTPKDNRESAG